MTAKILVAEDEPDLAKVIAARLKSAGHDVSLASNGQVALSMVKASKPDLIITDVLMPELDGFGLLKELKKNPNTASIPIIVLTARGKMADTFSTFGVAEFLAKPFDEQVFLSLVLKHLSLAKSPGPSVPVMPSMAQQPPPTQDQPDQPEDQVLQTTTNELLKKSSASPGTPKGSGKKIFILGKEKKYIRMISQNLADKHFIVDSATNSAQLIARINAFSPDIIIMEIACGNPPAQNVVSDIRHSRYFKTTPVLIYSINEPDKNETEEEIAANPTGLHFVIKACLLAGATHYLGSVENDQFSRTLNIFL